MSEIVYLVKFDCGYYAAKQPNYDWSYTDDILLAQQYKTLKKAKERGFWDCYRQISENFERYFDKVEEYKPNKNVQPPPYQIVSEGYNPYAKFKECK